MIFITTLVLIFIIRLRFPKNRSIAQVINHRYGRPVLLLFRKYEKLYIKLRKLECDIEFLNQCKAYNVLPKFLHFKLYRKNLQNSNLYRSWQFKLLNIEISSQKKQNSRTLKFRNDAHTSLKNQVSYIDMICLERLITDNSDRVIRNVKSTHSRKLDNLGIVNSLKPLDPSRVIFNYSDYVLSQNESNLLTLGLNFKLPIFKIDYFKYFLSFERMYNMLSRHPIFNPDNVPNILKDNIKFIANNTFITLNHIRYFHHFLTEKILPY